MPVHPCQMYSIYIDALDNTCGTSNKLNEVDFIHINIKFVLFDM